MSSLDNLAEMVKARRNKRSMFNWRPLTIIALIAPCVIVLVMLGMYPFVYSIWLSLHSLDLGSALDSAKFIGLSNYVDMFTNRAFWNSLGVTGMYVGGAVSVELILGFAIAILLNKKLWGGWFVRSAIIVPMVTTPVVVGLTWRTLFNTQYGIINYYLSQLHLPVFNWIADPSMALLSVMLVDIWQWTPFVSLILLAGLQTISVEVIEASQMDGASPLRQFWHITIPLMRWAILVALVFRAMDAFKVFDNIFTLTMGGPGSATETLSMHSYISGFRNFHIGYAAAVSLFLLIIVILICQSLLKLVLRERGE